MDTFDVILLLTVGFLGGIINVMAGGGSLLTLPLLIFLGLDPTVANGTNRVAIIFQNASAISGYRSKQVFVGKYVIFLAVSALLGAILGAKLAIIIDPLIFNKILAIVMILVVIMTLINPALKSEEKISEGYFNEKITGKYKYLGILAMFFVGIYGGFIQAGTGLFIMASLSFINRYTLLKANAAKAVIMLVYTLSAFIVFWLDNKINWSYGLILAIGMALGAWFTSRWSSGKGEKYIKYFMLVAVTAMAIKLWFF